MVVALSVSIGLQADIPADFDCYTRDSGLGLDVLGTGRYDPTRTSGEAAESIKFLHLETQITGASRVKGSVGHASVSTSTRRMISRRSIRRPERVLRV